MMASFETRINPIRARFCDSQTMVVAAFGCRIVLPAAVRALYESGKLLHEASGRRRAVAWLAIAVSIGLVYGVPAVGIAIAYVLGRHE